MLMRILKLSFVVAAFATIFAASTNASEIVSTGTECGPPVAVCGTKPCITYKHHLLGCKKFKCCETKEIVLQVKDPCTGCVTDVPVGIPCCCDDEPTVCCRKGVLCRDVVEYSWCCGFSVKMVINRCGDIVVHYHGI